MSTKTLSRSGDELIPLENAVFCLDCEVVSSSRGDECPACKSRSLVVLTRLVGGSLNSSSIHGPGDRVSFDITITIELPQMRPEDLNTALEGLTNVIGPRLARGGASFHVNVEPTASRLLPVAA